MLILKRISFPFCLGSSNYHAATWHFLAYISVFVASLSAVYRCWWSYFWTSALNWYEIQFFFQKTSVYLLGFLPQTDPIWRSVTLKGRISDIQLPENKSFFWFLLSPQEVRARSFFRTLYLWSKRNKDKSRHYTMKSILFELCEKADRKPVLSADDTNNDIRVHNLVVSVS